MKTESNSFQSSVLVLLIGICTFLFIIAVRLNHPLAAAVQPVTLSTGLDAQNDSVRCVLDSNQVLRLISRSAVLFTPASE